MRGKLMLTVIASVFAIAGCSSQHPNVVEIGDVDYIEVDSIQKARKNGFIVAKVAIFNKSKKEQRINYRFQWLDDQAFPVGGEESWKQKMFYGQQNTFITGIASVPEAVDFKIELRENSEE